MKKFNLFKEIIKVDKTELIQAINSGKRFGIDIEGNIKYAPYENREILIFSGEYKPQAVSALMPPKQPKIEDIFGKNYQIVEDDERVLIKAFSNWQELIGLNMPRASYDDTTADGVAEFSNKELEDIGWNATEFNIDYRTLVELIEDKCEGVILCIEQEEPYQFSGLGFIGDDDEAKKVIYEYSQEVAKTMIAENPLYAPDKLSDDEEEAAEFFKVL